MNLHYFITFSSRGSGVYRSLFLRTFMVMMFFITGSNGIYAGEDLKATIGTPASKGSWDGTKKVERGNNQNTCTALAIHTNEYAPTEEDDSEAAPELTPGWENDGLIVKIDFEEVGKDFANIGEEKTATNHTDNFSFVQFKGEVPGSGYKLYCLYNGDNKQTWDKSAVIQKDEIFGYYFQNIPKAQFYDRSAENNYMRAVLPKGALIPIQKSGAATIGFWVNGRVAVDAGLSYFDASMLYLSGPYHSAHYAPTEDNGTEASAKQYQSMFNIRCNGNTNGFLKDASRKVKVNSTGLVTSGIYSGWTLAPQLSSPPTPICSPMARMTV